MAVEALWNKDVNCPVCGCGFTAVNVRRSALVVEKRDYDFCCHYKGINPLYYLIWVCPFCYYAAVRKEDFMEVSDEIRGAILGSPAEMRQLAENQTFEYPRSFEAALASFKLAIHCYKLKKAVPSKLAGLYLNMACLCRTAEPARKEEERKYLELSRDKYNEALQTQTSDFGNMGEVGIAYLVGEIHYILGNLKEAIQSFSSIVSGKDKETRPDIVSTARQRWQEVKDEWRQKKKEAGEAVEEE